jgi:hypothetical protein
LLGWILVQGQATSTELLQPSSLSYALHV